VRDFNQGFLEHTSIELLLFSSYRNALSSVLFLLKELIVAYLHKKVKVNCQQVGVDFII
jgi:hypothetical protein